jgi:hypothetical protein
MSSPAPPSPADFQAAQSGAVACALDAYAALAIEGPDATEFLHAQLGSDVRGLGPGSSQLSSYHSAKGRVLANFLLSCARGDDPAPRYVALMRADLVGPLRKRLALFVLRSKVNLATMEGAALIGIGGPKGADAARSNAPPRRQVLTWPDGRLTLIADAKARDASLAGMARSVRHADSSVWDWLGIRAGVPLIDASLADQLLPQALNWDVLGGINFRKGCYPGQEVIARTHYLGRTKERLGMFHTASPSPPSGTRVYSAAFGGQACGVVVNAAPDVGGGAVLLAAAQTDAVDTDDLRLAAPEGPRLVRLPLPYALPPPRAAGGRTG